ncbi:hypothetical protein [Pseudactinotalea sp.]|uniref:hypothetical protein n=1 Tax=Pseudactinotalea sp. TaxID=1926260 RepID=UPI003B3AAA4C
MTDRMPGPETPAGLTRDAQRVAAALGVAATVLAVPAVLVAGGAAVGFAAVAVLVATSLSQSSSVLAWVLLVLAIAGLAVTVSFLIRVRATRRAGRDRDRLAADLLGLVDVDALTTAVLADLAELTSVEGGVRAISRARALWRLLRRLDMEEHAGQFARAKWFVPPEVGATWLLAQLVTWGGLGAWILVPIVGGARAAGWL